MSKKVGILFGSPRKEGNTAHLLVPFIEQLEADGAVVTEVDLYDKEISGCMACRTCQKDWTRFGCPIKDDMQEVFDIVLEAELIVLATPIYSWFCTAPMKAALDRLVYGMNKIYGEEPGPSLWEGKDLALICTSGYRPEKAADLLTTGMKRYCKHSKLNYRGLLGERHKSYKLPFMDDEKAEHARNFAKELLS